MPKGLKIFEITDFIGIIAFSISGFIIGARKGLDILGVLISAYLTALGGGVIRDVVAQKQIFAFSNVYPGLCVLIVVILSMYFKIHKKEIENKFIYILSDTIGLVSFSISGTIVGLQVGFNIFGVIFLSIVTAVGGGMLRDILINEIPFVLNRSFYATISIIIAVILYFMSLNYFTMLFSFIIGVLLRLFAIKKDFHLPRF